MEVAVPLTVNSTTKVEATPKATVPAKVEDTPMMYDSTMNILTKGADADEMFGP